MLVDRSCSGARPGLPLTKPKRQSGVGRNARPVGRGRAMEILIAAIVVALGLVAGASLLARRVPGVAGHPVAPSAEPARPTAAPTVEEDDGGLSERRAEVMALEQRLRAREEAVEGRVAELGERERILTERLGELESLKDRHVRSLERTAGMSASQARHQLLKEVEQQIRHDKARVLRLVEEET